MAAPTVHARVEQWVAHVLPLLAKEETEEGARTAAAATSGRAWVGRCVGAEQGLAGHTILTFECPPAGRGGRPPTALVQRGAPVVLGDGVRGIATHVADTALAVSVDSDEWSPEWMDAAVPVVPVRSDVTFKAMKYALRGGGMGYGARGDDIPPLLKWAARSTPQRKIVELAFGGEEFGGVDTHEYPEVIREAPEEPAEGEEEAGDRDDDDDDAHADTTEGIGANDADETDDGDDDDDTAAGAIDTTPPTPWAAPTKWCVPLNPSQEAAIHECITSSLPIHLILGPPGTGKTQTVSELIRQTVLQGKRVLVATPSNVAADNIVERLCITGPKASGKLRCVRVGHSGRLSEVLQPYSLDAKMATTDAAALGASAKRDMQKVQKKLKKTKGKERKALYHEIRALSRDMREMSRKMSREVLRGANVVVGTLVNAMGHVLRREKFDLVVIDEAAQALEAATWMVIPRGDRVVLAGDPFQLPPTVLSNSADLQTTLFERLYNTHRAGGTLPEGTTICSLLNTQYRMNRVISEWSSREFYGGRLMAADEVAEHLLTDLEGVVDVYPIDTAGVVVDTSELGFVEEEDEAGSKVNRGEAQRVVEYVDEMVAEHGVAEDAVAVITPYAAQRSLLRSLLPPAVEVGTVDSYQGREKDAVIISLVRANPSGDVGFLADYRRLNVAVTRARRHVVLVGAVQTLRRDAFLQRMLDYFEEEGTVVVP